VRQADKKSPDAASGGDTRQWTPHLASPVMRRNPTTGDFFEQSVSEKAMRSILITITVVVALAIGLWFGYIQISKSRKAVAESHILYIDDINGANVSPADEFESAFAIEPTCHGITLLRYSRLDIKSPASVQFLEEPLWALEIFDIPHPDHSDLHYGVDMTPLHFNGLRFNSGPVTVQGAVRSACFVAAGKGGRGSIPAFE